MDSIDRLLGALDACRRNPAPAGQRVPIPSTFVDEAQRKADGAKAELRGALRAAVVEVVREDYRANGELRQMLQEPVRLVVESTRTKNEPGALAKTIVETIRKEGGEP